MALHSRNSVSVSTGRRVMTPLNSSLACSPAEGLHASQEGTFKCAHRRAKKRCKAWYFGTWNVVDNEGTVETARLSSEKSESEDRRIDLVIRELDRYNIKVAALQETKWFGSHIYRVGKSVVLTARRGIPAATERRRRSHCPYRPCSNCMESWW